MPKNPFLDNAHDLWPETIRDVVRTVAGRESPDDVPAGLERLRERAGFSPSTWKKLLAGNGVSPPSRGSLRRLVAAILVSKHLEMSNGRSILTGEAIVHAAISTRKRWLYRQWERAEALNQASMLIADEGRQKMDAPRLLRAVKTGPSEGECRHCWSPFVDPDGPSGPDAVGLPPPGFGEGEEHWMCPTWFASGRLTDAGRAEIERRRVSPPHPDELPTRP